MGKKTINDFVLDGDYSVYSIESYDTNAEELVIPEGVSGFKFGRL